MADDKWISGLFPAAPPPDTARHVLGVRFAAVAAHLPTAVEHAADDAEHVHRLRVASRRAGAALPAFADCFPAAWNDRTRRLLRDIRRAAGDARDWDVFAEAVRRTNRLDGRTNEPARSYLLGLASGFRAVAQAKLRTAAADHGTELEEVIATLDPQPTDAGQTTGELAVSRIERLFDEFDAAIADRPRSAGALHEVRIAGKRLRYAIEVFACIFPLPLRDTIYPAVAQVQELLGRVNDAHVAAERLAAIRSGVRKVAPPLADLVYPGLDALAEGVGEDAREGKRAFRRWCYTWSLIRGDYPLRELLRPAETVVSI